ncbi:hypothetical protein AtubIFM61612_007865 [Aspergillus tubingensis]|nr:hypothetical protein AtubIFM61612_007865 [Aspergillus tubingensis]
MRTSSASIPATPPPLRINSSSHAKYSAYRLNLPRYTTRTNHPGLSYDLANPNTAQARITSPAPAPSIQLPSTIRFNTPISSTDPTPGGVTDPVPTTNASRFARALFSLSFSSCRGIRHRKHSQGREFSADNQDEREGDHAADVVRGAPEELEV